MTTLQLNNPDMTILQASMGKLHRVLDITPTPKDDPKNERVTVAVHDRFHVIADAYGPTEPSKPLSKGLHTSKMGMYVRSMGKHFAVSHLVDTPEKANQLCEADPDIGVIAEDRAGVIYLAKIKPVWG